MTSEVLATPPQWILGAILMASCLGVLLLEKPVHASLSFLGALLSLAGLYLQLDAEFIATMQVLVYAGAILVIFVFVIVLFQDAHDQIAKYSPLSNIWLIAAAASLFFVGIVYVAVRLLPAIPPELNLPQGYGTVHNIGKALYFDFFFPFEAVILLFLVAMIGALYIAKKERAK